MTKIRAYEYEYHKVIRGRGLTTQATFCNGFEQQQAQQEAGRNFHAENIVWKASHRVLGIKQRQAERKCVGLI